MIPVDIENLNILNSIESEGKFSKSYFTERLQYQWFHRRILSDLKNFSHNGTYSFLGNKKRRKIYKLFFWNEYNSDTQNLIKSALKKTLRNNLTYENLHTKITNKLLAAKCNSTLKQKGVYIKNKRIVLCWKVYMYFIILVDWRRNSIGSYL